MSNREDQVNLRVNATEAKQLDRVAQSMNLSKSEAIRELVSKEAKKLNKN